MNTEANAAVDAFSIRSAVRSYAAHLSKVLSRNMGVITEAAEPIPRQIYQQATLQPHDSQSHDEWRRERSRGGSTESLLTEDAFFRKWHEDCAGKESDKSILIIGPAGAGKSCLLESFALQMLDELLDDEQWPDSMPLPPRVPMLISLAKLQDLAFEVYLATPEAQHASQTFLTPKLIRHLLDNHRLVFLFDGFDEAHGPRNHLVRTLRSLNCNYVLTSRAGHGEDAVVTDSRNRHSLRELTYDRAQSYVAAYFRERPCVDAPHSQLVDKFNGAWNTYLGRLLRRPMYLMAWCAFVHSTEGRRTPASLGALADLLFYKLLRWKGTFGHLSRATFIEATKGFADWYGRLGCLFADSGFTGLAPSALISHDLIGGTSGTFTADGQTISYESVAVRSGLLLFNEATESYHITKVPVTEYIIGKYLADDAFQRPESPQRLIEHFRRWACRPELHDILDYTLDILFNASSDPPQQWGNYLLQWVSDAGTGEASDAPCNNLSEKPDLVSPLACAVVRWNLLKPSLPRHAIRPSLGAVVSAIDRLICFGQLRGRTAADLVVTDDLIFPLIRGMLPRLRAAMRRTAPRFSQAGFEWLLVINTLAGRISEEGASTLVIQLIDHYRARLGALRKYWRGHFIITPAAEMIGEREAGQILNEWMKQHDRASGDALMQKAWRDAIVGGACQLSEGQALEWVRRFFEKCMEAPNKKAAGAWALAMNLACDRLSGSTVGKLLEEWIQQHKVSDDRSSAEAALRRAIWAAAGHVAKPVAPRLVKDLIQSYKPTNGDDSCAWRHAIEGAAGRVEPDAVRALIPAWVCEMQLAQDDTERQMWSEAIYCAADAVEESGAGDLIVEWVGEHGFACKEPNAQAGWRSAILGAASRVNHTQRATVLEKLITHYECTGVDTESREVWGDVLADAAEGLDERLANQWSMHWLHQHESRRAEPALQETCRKVISAVAWQVSHDTAVGLLPKLIKQFKSSRGDRSAREEWYSAIAGASRRIREGRAPRQGQPDAVQVCNALLKVGLRDIAFNVAANNRSVAIVCAHGDAPFGKDTGRVPRLRAVPRKNLVLAVDSAPPRVRAVLIEKDIELLEGMIGNVRTANNIGAVGDRLSESLAAGVQHLRQFPELRMRCSIFDARLKNIKGHSYDQHATSAVVRSIVVPDRALSGKADRAGPSLAHWNLSAADEKLIAWFDAIEYRARLQELLGFWCIGYTDKEAILSCGFAKGWDTLQAELVTLRDVHNLAFFTPRVSQQWIRGVVRSVEQLYNAHPFPDDSVSGTASRVKLRALQGTRGLMKEPKWTEAALNVWLRIDRFFELKDSRPFRDTEPHSRD